MSWRLPLSLLLLLSTLSCLSEPAPPFDIGSRGPHFDLPKLGGGSLDSDSLIGTPTVVVFWATWCLPCIDEIPILNEIADSGEAQVVSIALDDAKPETIRRFTEEHDLRYTVLLGNEEIFRRYGGFSVPYTLVLDVEFSLVAKHRGRLTTETLRNEIGNNQPTGSWPGNSL